MDENNNWSIFNILLKRDLTTKTFRRNLVVVFSITIIILLLLCGFVWLLSILIFGEKIITPEVTKEGVLMFKNKHSKTIVVPSNAGWIKTGITKYNGDEIFIEATGRVNVGFPTYNSGLDQKNTLCELEMKRKINLKACQAWRALDWKTHFSHDKSAILGEKAAKKFGIDKKFSYSSLDELSCLCRQEFSEKNFMNVQNDNKKEKPWTEYDTTFIQKQIHEGLRCKDAEGGFPPLELINKMEFSEVLTLTDSCIKTWLLRGQVYKKFGQFGFTGVDGISGSMYSKKNNEEPSFPEREKLYPSYLEDSGMICQNHTHGSLVGFLANSENPGVNQKDLCFKITENKKIKGEEEGEVWLAVNDSNIFREQNMGSFFVVIRVSSPWYKFW